MQGAASCLNGGDVSAIAIALPNSIAIALPNITAIAVRLQTHHSHSHAIHTGAPHIRIKKINYHHDS